MKRFLKLSLLLVALTLAFIEANAAGRRKVVSIQTPPAEESVDEAAIAAKLVIDAESEAEPARLPATMIASAADAIPAEKPLDPNGEKIAEAGTTTGGEKPAEKSPSKAEIAKLAENEIPVLAGAKETKKATESHVARIMISLGALIIALAATAFGLKRWAGKKGGKEQNTKIQMLTQFPLGPKKSLAIVQVAGESILIGITDHNISMLKTLALIDDEVPEEVPRHFDSALMDFEDEVSERGVQRRDREDFAVRGLNEIRDTFSVRSKNAKNY